MRMVFSARCLSFLIGALVSSAPLFAVDILQVYREALANDAQYAAARATAEAGREKLPQGLAGLLPAITVTGNTTGNRNSYDYRAATTQVFDRSYNSNGWNLNLTQPLFRWQNFVLYGQAQLQVAQTEANFAQASQDLILRVAQAYLDVLYAQENLKAVRASKDAIAQQLEQAKKNFEVGTATITDAQEAQSRFDLATSLEISTENDLEVKRYALSAIVGKSLGPLNRLRADAMLMPPQPANMDQWVAAAEKDSFAVQAQEAAAEVAAKEIERNRAGHYPTVDIAVNYGKSSSILSSTAAGMMEATPRNIALQFNVPLFQGGGVNSKTREAVANRDAARASLDGARRTAALNARQSYLGVVSGLAQLRALEAALISSTSALESNKLGYDVGVRINIDVLNAENQVYVTKRDLAKARIDTLMSQLKLKSAVGALSETDLEQITPLFEAP